MICPKCGKQLPDNAAFCGACGNALTNVPKHVTAPTQSAPMQQSVRTASHAQPTQPAPAQPAPAQPTQPAPAQQSAYATPPAQPAPAQPSAQSPYAAGPMSVAGASPAAAVAPVYGTQGVQAFDNARRGIKTMFHSEVLMFISAAITFFVGLLAIGAGFAGANNLAYGLAGATGFASLALGVIAIVAFIMRLVGLFRASKDEKTFLWAFIATFAAVACNILVAVITYNALRSYDYGLINAANGVSTISTFIQLAVYVLIFFGIMTLAKRMGNSNVASTAMVMLIVAAVAYLLATFLPMSSVAFYVIRLICALVPDVLLLVILLKANKMFA